MPSNVDERVVQMRFDNDQFESGAKKTISTLEELKKQSDLKDVKNGINNFNTDPMTQAIEKVKVSFDALEVVGKRVLENLTDSMYGFVTRTVKQLTVAPISEGFKKFGEKTTSVATLVGQGYQLSVINEQLEKLMTFADETSYSFTDMVNNISKFTATGQALEPSVQAMEGIALWAASAGQGPATAARVMYQVSQAMSKGAFKYDDYKSIQNASMDTIQFRKRAAQAAVDAKVLKEEIVEVNGELQSFYTTASGKSFTLTELFSSDALSREQWFTSDVMMDVFGGYSKAFDVVEDYIEEHADAYKEATGEELLFKTAIEQIRDEALAFATQEGVSMDEALQALGYDIDMFSLKAAAAGQETRTWGDVMDATLDAVSSGWMRTFELIFGTQKEATEFFSSVVEGFWEIFAGGGEGRNTFLSALMDDNITKALNAAAEAGFTVEDLEAKVRELAINSGQNVEALEETFGSLVDAIKQGKLSADFLQVALQDLWITGKKGNESLNPDEAIEKIKQLAHGDLGLDAKARKEMAESYGLTEAQLNIIDANMRNWKGAAGEKWVHDYILQQLELAGTLDKVADKEGEAVEVTEEQTAAYKEAMRLLDKYSEVSGRTLLKESVLNILGSVADLLGAIRSGFEKAFGSAEERGNRFKLVLIKIHDFIASFRLSESALNGIANIFGFVFGIIRKVGQVLKPVVGIIGGAIQALMGFIDRFFSLFDTKSDVFAEFSNAEGILGKLKVILSPFGSLLGTIKEKLAGVWSYIQPIFNSIANSPIMQGAIGLLGGAITDIGDAFNSLIISIQGANVNLDSLKDTFEKIKTVLDFLFTGLFGDKEEFKAKISIAFDTLISTLKEKAKNIPWATVFDIVKAGFLGAIVAKVVGLLTSMQELTETAKTWAESLKTPFLEFGKAIKRMSKAATILIIATAILALAISIRMLCAVDQDKFFNVALTLGILMLVLAKIAKNLNGAFQGNSFNLDHGVLAKINVIPALMGALIGIAAVILAAAFALKRVEGMRPETLIAGVLAILAVFISAALTLGLISKYASNINENTASALIGIAIIIASVALALSQIKETPTDNIITLMVGLTAIVLALAGLLYVAKDLEQEQIDSLAKMFIKFGIAILMLSAAMRLTQSMGSDISSYMGFLVAAGILLLMMVILTSLAKDMDTSGITQIATSMVILSAAILILVPPLMLLSLLPAGKVIAAAAAIALVAIALGGAIALAGQANPAVIWGVAAAFIALSIGLSMLIAVVGLFTVGMLVIATAIDWGGMTQRLENFSAAMGILGKAVLKLWPIVVFALLLAVAMLAFGAGLFFAGTGLTLASNGLIKFAIAIYLVSAALPLLAEGISAMVDLIIQKGPEIAKAAGIIIAGIAMGLVAKKLEVAGAITEVGGAILTAISGLSPAMIPVILTLLAAALNALLSFIQPLAEFIVKAIVKLIDDVATALDNYSGAILNALNHICTTVVTLFIKAATNSIGVLLVWLTEFIANLLEGFGAPQWIVDKFRGWGDKIAEGVDVVEDAAEKAQDSALDKMQHDVPEGEIDAPITVNPVVTESEPTTTLPQTRPKNVTGTAGPIVKREPVSEAAPAASVPTPTVESPVTVTGDSAAEGADEVTEWLNGASEAVDGASPIPVDINDILDTGGIGAGGGGSLDLSSIVGQFTGTGGDAGNGLIDAFKGSLTERGPELLASVQTACAPIASVGTETGTAVGGNVITEAVTSMTGGLPTVEEASTTLGEKMRAGAGTAAENGETDGQMLDEGIARGMNNHSGVVVSAAYSLAYKMKDALMDAWEINSPSKVTAEIAKGIPEGVAKGINDNTNIATDAGYSMADDVIASVSPIITNLAAIMDSNYDIQPTITPIVDMSNVDGAAASVATLLGTDTMTMGLNSSISHRIDGITSAAIAGNRNYTNDLQQLISINRELLDSSRAGGNVYLSDGVIAGMVNRRLGVL